MALEVFMPRLTHDMQVGILVEWYKKESEQVQEGEPLFAVETDKATVEVPAEATGVLRGIRFTPGDAVPVGEVMGWISAVDEDLPLVEPLPNPAPASAAPAKAQVSVPSSPQVGPRVVASPVARRMAQEHQVDLSQIKGHGPQGRIIEEDVQSYLAKRGAPPMPMTPPGEVPYDVFPLSRLRQSTGQSMLASVLTAPHFDLEVEVDMSQASRWRARSSEEVGADVSITALLVKVVAEALRSHPQVNTTFVEGEARVYQEINIAVAVAIEEGLLAPVIRRADAMSLRQIQETLKHLRDKAKQRRLARSELSGGTFTVSNLGMYGIDAFRAIINPPQAAILAVGRIAERPVGVDGQIILRPMMRLVLSIDHRLLDGAQAAPFLVEVRRKLENPPMLP